jgi:outer membrane protein OmpA-like peptidoglycan-associated protein
MPDVRHLDRSARRRGAPIALLALALAPSLSACAGLNNTQKGTIIGATTGAVVGGVIGNNTGRRSTAQGAIIGAAVGGAAGMIIGHQMDKQAGELAKDIPGATVERVGEGIQVTFASGLLYDYDSDRVRAEAATNLRNLAASLDKYPNTEVLIVGHTDDRGEGWYNQDLSLRRARSAADYLVSRGVEQRRVRPTGRGEDEPTASNATDAGRQQNRRVEVAIYANEEYREQVSANN